MGRQSIVKPTLLFRMLILLVVAPLFFIGLVFFSMLVLLPYAVRMGISLQGAVIAIIAAFILYNVLAIAFELELVTWSAVRLVERRWIDRVRSARAPWRYFFYCD